MIFDGLWDPYGERPHGHAAATNAPPEYKFSREAQDEFAKESFRRALAAQKEGLFDAGDRAGERPAEEGRRRSS